MPTLEENLTAAIAAQNALTVEVAGKVAAINAATAAQLASFNTWKSQALDVFKVRFDSSLVYDKTTLVGTGTTYVDPGDNTRSVWRPASVIAAAKYFYAPERALARLFASVIFSYRPGENEIPPFSTDKCYSLMQFVFADSGASSSAIDARITALGIILPKYGSWDVAAKQILAPTLRVAGGATDMVPYVRFVNERFVSGAGAGAAQAINTFGGNSYASLIEATVYSNLQYQNP